MNENHGANTELEENVPVWITDALETTAGTAYEAVVEEAVHQQAVPEEFLARCKDTARAAVAVQKMRRLRGHIGFAPVSLSMYLYRLAEAAGETLQNLLTLLHTRATACEEEALLLLARRIEIERREALLYLRIGLAQQFFPDELATLQARARGMAMHDCEQVLAEVESRYSSAALDSLATLSQMVAKQYDTMAEEFLVR